jgi:uncharacterized protein
MSVSLKTPGVYIDEVSTSGLSVAAVPTAVPGFVGFTDSNTLPDGTSLANKPVRITSLLEYEQKFGGPELQAYVHLQETIPGIVTLGLYANQNFLMYYQIQMFFANGGGVCYVVSVATIDEFGYPEGSLFAPAIDALEQIDEITILVAPPDMGEDQGNYDSNYTPAIYAQMLAQCAKLNRFAILDTHGSSISYSANYFRNTLLGLDNLKYGTTYFPHLNVEFDYLDERVMIADNRISPKYYNKLLSEVRDGFGVTKSDMHLYWKIKNFLGKKKMMLPPSAAMAGVYARVDRTQGVWRAPANVGLVNVTGLAVEIDNLSQESLNVDPISGKSINVIRNFKGRGPIVWGARTLAGNDKEWRYVNVRRLFNYVEESLKKATAFVVFEPNTLNTWQRVKSGCEAFLTNLWRDGGLAGASTKEAFYVRVGLGSTMTANDILNGKMLVEVGLAASRPAEFILLKFSHALQQ